MGVQTMGVESALETIREDSPLSLSEALEHVHYNVESREVNVKAGSVINTSTVLDETQPVLKIKMPSPFNKSREFDEDN